MTHGRLYFAIALGAALLYLSWVFASRYSSTLRMQQRLAAEGARRDAELLRLYGGKSLRIVQFYAPSGSDMAGRPPMLCYGVLNAKSVRIEPLVKDVWVSLSRCVEVSPAKDTRYKLIAEGHDGQVVEAEVLVPARR